MVPGTSANKSRAARIRLPPAALIKRRMAAGVITLAYDIVFSFVFLFFKHRGYYESNDGVVPSISG